MNVHIPTAEEIYRIAYITNCGWEMGFSGGWIHPKKKPFEKTDLYDEEWPLEDAFWQAYSEKNVGD